MNQALLTELQSLNAYPSVTILHTTAAGGSIRPADAIQLHDLVDEADRRLAGDVLDSVRAPIIETLRRLATSAASGRATRAVALCASPDHEAIVRLGREVQTRVVVDHTFATRDMVADANRTATFRVVTISERTARLLVGDRERLVEVHDWHWPLERVEEEGDEAWEQRLDAVLARERQSFEAPTVLAGVARSITALVDADRVSPVGTVSGNHDTTSPHALHDLAWPLVDAWLGRDGQVAMARLEQARGSRVFAGGVDEVWALANDGRVELLVVEDDYRLTARIGGDRLRPSDGLDDPDVVDELIETVVRAGGEAVMVPPGELSEHDRLAAVLRY